MFYYDAGGGGGGAEEDRAVVSKELASNLGIEKTGWLPLLQAWIRRHVTRGWWVGIQMKPRIRVMRKQRGD